MARCNVHNAADNVACSVASVNINQVAYWQQR